MKGKGAAALVLAFFVAGCAAYSGRGLQPGTSRSDDVERVMGAPAMRWAEAGGAQLLAYPRGPFGFHTFMVRIDADGTMTSVENVLDPKHFARIRAGMTQEEVLRTLGPPQPQWTAYFPARDELVWEWRYCDDWSEPARFNVLFDGTSGKVRTTMSLVERTSVPFGRGNWRDWCSR